MGSDKSEMAVLPIGLKPDELLTAAEEIFDCQNQDPKRQNSLSFMSLAQRIVDLV